MRRIGVLGVAVALATAGSSVLAVGLGQGKGSSSKVTYTDYPAKIIFQDRGGDAITSDGKGAYIHGVDGVTAIFQTASNGTGGQFLLKFGAVKGKILRKINYAYSASGEVTPCDSTSTDNPTGVIADSGYVDFLNTANMAIGSTIAKQGGFHTAVGTFRFHDATKLDPINPYNCGDLLVVTRGGATTWTVTTDVTPGQTYFNSIGTPVYTADPEQVGSRSQLSNDTNHQFFGNYRMPFFATISCLSAAACPAGG